MIRKYHKHKLQTNPWHREEEPQNNHDTPGRQTKQSNQLSLPHQDDCKTRRDIKKRTTKHRTFTESHNGSNSNQQVNNNRTTALEWTAAQAKRWGGLNAFYWYQIFALDSAGVELQKLFSSHGSLLTIAFYYHAETSLCFCAQPRKSLRFLNLTQRARLLEIQEYITRNGCWLSIYLYVVCSFLKEENRRECLTAA